VGGLNNTGDRKTGQHPGETVARHEIQGSPEPLAGAFLYPVAHHFHSEQEHTKAARHPENDPNNSHDTILINIDNDCKMVFRLNYPEEFAVKD
jgi:hypothetical protein